MTARTPRRAAARWCACLGLLATAAGAQQAALLPSDDLFRQPNRAAHRFDDFTYTVRERQAEAAEKLARVRKALAARKLDGVVLATERHLNWLSAGGKDTVVWAQRETPVKLVVTADRVLLLANNIEGPRLMTEELSGLGCEWVRYAWHQSEARAAAPLLRGKRLAFDHPGAAAELELTAAKETLAFTELYYPLTAGELRKYRWLGRKTAEVLEQVAGVLRPGMTERDIQYLLNREFWYWDIFPTVVLSAVDERFRTYRHPVVQGETLRRYAALNVCCRRWGLVVSTTRLVHFGEPDEKLARAWSAGTPIIARMWHATRPGKTLGDVFGAAQAAYRDAGFENEWKLHHQGGLIHGLERLFLVTPGDKTPIRAGMAVAWNPTLQGAKWEDTLVVNADDTLENLTASPTWPTTEVTVEGVSYRVPGLLIRR